MTGPRRILRVITRLNVGGPTRHVRILMEGLDPARFRQLLVHGPCAAGEGARLLAIPGETLELSDLVRPLDPWRDLRAARALRAVMEDFRPDLVHTHQGKAGFIGRRVATRFGVPAIHTHHGHTFEGYFGPLRGALVAWAERSAARRSRLLICQSPSQRAALARHLGKRIAGRLRVVAPAVDPEALLPEQGRPDLRAELGTPPDRKVILLPARLVSIKRPLQALEILAVLAGHVDVELWVAGEGPLEEAVQERSRSLALAERVRLLGWRPRMGSLLEAADLVLLTSAQEGTPLALLEAMAAGVPVACTDVGGVRDILGDAGLLLEAGGSAEEQAAGILPLLADPDLCARAVARGRERALYYGAPRLLAAMTEIYTGLLGGP